MSMYQWHLQHELFGLTFGAKIIAFFSSRWKVVPRYLQGVDYLNIDTGTVILGEAISSPICAGPSGFHKLGHQLGELETAKGLFFENKYGYTHTH